MGIRQHPEIGTILLCDFAPGFKEPEMVKRRPVVVISPRISDRPGLCTIVCLSLTAPAPPMPYHFLLTKIPPLPRPWVSQNIWVKGDMVYAVSFERLNFLVWGEGPVGRRTEAVGTVGHENLKEIRKCVLRGLGLSVLTKHL